MVKDSPINAGDLKEADLIFSGSGRSPGGERGNSLQYPCLENPTDRGGWRATVRNVSKSWTRMKQLSTHTCTLSYFLHQIDHINVSCR